MIGGLGVGDLDAGCAIYIDNCAGAILMSVSGWTDGFMVRDEDHIVYTILEADPVDHSASGLGI